MEKTNRIPIEEQRGDEPPRVLPRVAWLMAYPHEGRVVRRHLPLGVDVVVGRDPSGPSIWAVEEPDLSRQHVLFVLREDGVHLRDLGSMNGVFVRGLKVNEAIVQGGDELYLGSLRVVIDGDTEAATSVSSSYSRLRTALADEIARCVESGRACSLMMVRRGRTMPRSSAHVTLFLEQVLGRLRSFDRVALYSEEMLLLLLPEMSRASALLLASTLGEPGLGLDAGVATFREDGRTPDALEDRCYSALRGVSEQTRREGQKEPVSVSLAGNGGGAVVAESPAMRALLGEIERGMASRRELSIVIRGETGVGKEVVATYVHAMSKRRNKPLVALNCGGIPSTLSDSTLFGHEKGSFTGAIDTHQGVFERAHGGVLFLDEIGELPLTTQAALLRVLEVKCVQRVGGKREIPVDIHLVVATHRDLGAMVAEGTFRKDLYYRLDQWTLLVPPLRERPEDIEALVFRFLEETHGLGEEPRGISAAAMGFLKGHSWPGNVRELKNVVFKAAAFCRGREVLPEDLPEQIRRRQGDIRAGTNGACELGQGGLDVEGLPVKYKEAMEHVERWFLGHALTASGGSSTKAAARLGLPARTLRHHIKRLGLRSEDD